MMNSQLLKVIAAFLFLSFGNYLHSVKGQNCNRLITTLNGSFDDGSGVSNYANNLSCTYLIQPANANSLTINFSTFDLGVGDIVKVYDGVSRNASQVAQYTRGNSPATFTSTSGAVFIEFITDALSVGQGWSINYTATTAPCSRPTGLTATSTEINTAILTWDAVPGALGYELEFRIPDSDWTRLPRLSGNTAVVSGLDPGTTYQSWVRAVCANNVVSEWSEGTFYTTKGNPGDPTPACTLTVKLAVQNITPTSAVAAWDFDINYEEGNKTQAGKRYELAVRLSNRILDNISDNWGSLIFEANSYQLTGLTPNTSYDVMGRVICTLGDTSDWSDIKTFKTLAEGASNCNMPSGLSVGTEIIDNFKYVQVSWEDPAAGSTQSDENTTQAGNKYQVGYKRSTDFLFDDRQWSNIVTTGTSLLIPELSANQEYNFRVRKVCENGDSSEDSPIFPYITPPDLGPRQDRLCLGLNRNKFQVGEEITVSVSLTDLKSPLSSISPQIQYDAEFLEFMDVASGDLFGNPIATVQNNAFSGILNFSISSTEPSNSNGQVANLIFKVKKVPSVTREVRFRITASSANTFNNIYYELLACPDVIAQITADCAVGSISIANDMSAVCENTQVVLNASSAITYAWEKDGVLLPNETGQSLVVSQPGSYRAMTMNAVNCEVLPTNSINITYYPNPVLNLSTTPATSSTSSNGVVTIEVTGGNSPFTYQLNSTLFNGSRVETSAEPAFSFGSLAGGKYDVTVVDAKGCYSTESVNVNNFVTCPTANIIPAGNATICQGQTLVLNATTSGNYKYQWYKDNQVIPGATQNQYPVTSAGTYLVQISLISNTVNCTPALSAPVTVNVSSGINITTSTGNASASNMGDGNLSVTANGGQAPYTYLLSNGTRLVSYGTVNFNNLFSGSYTVTVTDINGCQNSQNVTISISTSSNSSCQVPVVSVSPIGPNAQKVSWNSIGSAICYVIAYGPINVSEDFWAQFMVPHPTTSINLNGLTPGSYGVKVRANCTLCSTRSGLRTEWSITKPFFINATRLSGSDIDNFNFSVYPNPSNGEFMISGKNFENPEIELQVINLNGEVIIRKQMDTDKLEIPISITTAGVYIVEVKDGARVLREKIIVY